MHSINTSHKSEVMCPWCGHVETEAWEIDGIYSDDDLSETSCDSCGRDFVVRTYAILTFSTRRPGDDTHNYIEYEVPDA